MTDLMTTDDVRSMQARVAGVVEQASAHGLSDHARIELLRALEELKATAAAAQACVMADFVASQRAEQASAGVAAARRSRGIASQVGLALKVSPHRAARVIGVSVGLVTEMPHTMSALTAGRLTERRAGLLVQHTAILSREDRAQVDLELCSRPGPLAGLGDAQVEGAVRKVAYRIDPHAAVRNASKAAADRHVSIRPAPDTMARITALLPVAQGVALFAALKQQTDTLMAQGDGRTRGQLMADTLVERVTGQAQADAVPVGVNLTIAASALLDSGAATPAVHEPAHLDGFGPVPAEWARDLVRTALERLGTRAAGWVRRIVIEPGTGDVVAMDSRARSFPDGLERLIHVRDAGICRTPWCGAPIRQDDHVVSVEQGGVTSAANGQGLCEQCNYAKQAPGWTARPRPGPRHTVETVTPTGHTHSSTAPPVPGTHVAA